MPDAGRKVGRAEPVGSLLREASITEAIDKAFDGMTTAAPRLLPADRADAYAEMRSIADEVVADLVRRQVAAGMDVVTDGEIRRTTFLSSFWDSVDGMAPADERIQAFAEDGTLIFDGYADPVVAARLTKVANPLLDEIPALERANSPVPYKLTIPAPSYYLTLIVERADSSAYALRLDFMDDAVEITREIVAEAIAAGATWIQFDFPVYPSIADPDALKTMTEAHGVSAEELLDRSIAADLRSTEGIPDDVTIGMHICRGNIPGGFWKGSLEPVAERMFGELPHERWLIEWDDMDREGDFAPLRHVPKGKVVALGVVSTKVPEVESDDQIVAKIEEAAAHLALDQLALCPQCGFASISHDNNMHLDAAQDLQWRKLELIGRVADRVWGRD